jgi:hypothetical protein
LACSTTENSGTCSIYIFTINIYYKKYIYNAGEPFKYLGSILKNDGKCTCEIKCRIAMAKAAFNKKRALFTGTLEGELMKKQVKCYIWSIDLYGAETWTLRATDKKHLEGF